MIKALVQVDLSDVTSKRYTVINALNVALRVLEADQVDDEENWSAHSEAILGKLAEDVARDFHYL